MNFIKNSGVRQTSRLKESRPEIRQTMGDNHGMKGISVMVLIDKRLRSDMIILLSQ